MLPEAWCPYHGVVESPEHERRSVTEYVELEAGDETVTHAEKIASEHMMGHEYNVWDVQTDKNRWWVGTARYVLAAWAAEQYLLGRPRVAESGLNQALRRGDLDGRIGGPRDPRHTSER